MANFAWEAFKARWAGNHARAADLYRAAGKPKKAMEMFLKAGMLDQAARVAMQMGDHAAAAQLFAREGNFRAAGEIYEKAGRHAQAVECYARAGDHALAARVHEKAGQFDRAAEAWMSAGRRDMAAAALVRGNAPDRAVPILEDIVEALARDPLAASDAGPQIRKYAAFCAQFHAARNDFPRAASLYEKAGMAAEAAAAHAKGGDPRRALKIYADLRDWENAADLVGAIPVAPGDVETLGDALIQAGRYEQAAAFFGEHGHAFRAADCLEQIGEFARAAALYAEKGDALRAADLYAQAEDFARAAPLYEKGGSVAGAALCHERAGNREKAAELYLAAKKPIDAARLFRALGNDGKSIEALQMIPSASPHYRDAALHLAQLFTKTARYDLAVEKFREAIGNAVLGAENVEKYYHLGVCLEEMKKFAKAREIYTRILAVRLGFRDVEARLDALKKKEAEAPVDERTLTAQRERMSLTLSGRYEITDAVDETLYKGWDSTLGRVVAIRRLALADAEARRPDYMARLREAASLSHPNIVTLHDTAAQGDNLYIFHEYVGGSSLRQILDARKTMTPAAAISVAAQVARALEHAHGKGVVHSALRPECVLVSGENEVKVADFALGEPSPAYAPPESAASPAGDVRQLALLFCEMASGKPSSDAALTAGVPSGVAAAVRRALSPDPAKRPSARDMLQAFSEAGLMPGAVIAGRYEILAEIGEGGMGKIYKALDRELGEEIALKFLHRDLVRDALAKERFLREIKVLRKITHPNVVRVHDLGRFEEHEFITMEFLDAENLFDRVRRRGPFSVPEGARAAARILDGLEQAHRHRVIHRDLKPQNIVVLSDGTPKILDFGIAHAAGAKDVTGTGEIVGSPKYMPPEQILGKDVDARSDLYAIGAVLYFMWSGREPFDAPTIEAVVARHIERMPEPLSQIVPGFPEALSAAVQKALQKNPKARFPSAAAMREAILAGAS